MEVSIVLGVGMLLTIMGFVLLALFLGVLVFALFMVYKGVKESKQYKNVALPGLMNSKSNTNKIDEDSIEALDLNSYKADEDKKTQTVASVPTGPAMPMPSPIPMPSPFESTNASVPVESSSSNDDQQSKGMTSVDPGNTHDDDDADSDPGSIGLPTFSIPESDKGTGVDSMMSALNDFSFDSTRLQSDEPNNDTINNEYPTASDVPSMTLPTLTAPSLDSDIASGSTVSSNPFRPIS